MHTLPVVSVIDSIVLYYRCRLPAVYNSKRYIDSTKTRKLPVLVACSTPVEGETVNVNIRRPGGAGIFILQRKRYCNLRLVLVFF